MQLVCKSSRNLHLVYAYMQYNGLEVADNEITELYTNLRSSQQRTLPTVHHTKLATYALVSKNDLSVKKNLGKTEAFDVKQCGKEIPKIKRFKSNFDVIYRKAKKLEIEQIKKKLPLLKPFIAKVAKAWRIPKPEKLILINNPFVYGGHLYMLNSGPVLVLNFFHPYDNMIRHIFCHEFSHYFQNRIFDQIKDEVNNKAHLYQEHHNYGEWHSLFAENLIEAVIFTLIRPPPLEHRAKVQGSLEKELFHTTPVISSVLKHKFQKIGKKEVVTILHDLE